MMFAFKKGEALRASQQKTRLRNEARKEWPSLHPADLAPVKSEAQLAVLVGLKTGRTPEEATVLVRHWMERQGMRPDIGSGSLARRPSPSGQPIGGAIGPDQDHHGHGG